MSKIARMMQQATAGAAGAGLDVDEVFRTFVYNGTGGNATITNGIDLSGEGGLVITKRKTNSYNWGWFDTVRGVNKALHSNDQDPEETLTNNGVTAFNSNGFSIGDQAIVNSYNSSDKIASWTFRKAPNFFDVQTYTGDGSYMYVSHNLGSTPGMIIVKSRDSQSDGDATSWHVWHRSAGTRRLYLNDDTYNAGGHRIDAIGSSSFRVGGEINNNGKDYVAYIFAHNNNDGGFGPSSDQDIIKCGSYTGNDSDSTRIDVNLGFEPQFLLIKNAASVDRNWTIVDDIRGFTFGNAGSGSGTTDRSLAPNLQSSEETCSTSTVVTRVDPTPTGFAIRGKSAICNELGNHIYVAIRRGSLVTPTDATKVFDVTLNPTSPNVPSDTLVDTLLFKSTGSSQSWWVADRLRQGAGNLQTDTTAAESSSTYLDFRFDQMTGTRTVANSFGSNYVGYTWKRAPSYFDVCCYVGNDTTGRTVSHNLGAVPEMMWTKRRNSTGGDWFVYHKDIGNTKYLTLNSTASASTSQYTWNNTTPTESVFTIATGANNTNGDNFIAYLFATVAGVSKVGSFSHTFGSATNVNCGFSNGSRFVLLKRTDSTGNWEVYDTERGLVSGNDSLLRLNTTDDQSVGHDAIDPLSSGFSIPSSGLDTGSYIFYAIA